MPRRISKRPSKEGKRPYNVSAAVLAANAANAEKSTGPKCTDVTSMNALKDGAYSRSLVLPGEDPEICQRRLESWPKLLGATTDIELYVAREIAELSVVHDRTKKANRDALHLRMIHAQKKNRKQAESTVVGLAEQLEARPTEIVPMLLQTAAGTDFILDQFQRLDAMLICENGIHVGDWEWAIRLSGRRPCDFLFDRVAQHWTIAYLGSMPYPESDPFDLKKAHIVLDPHQPSTITRDEFDRRVAAFIRLVPQRQVAVAKLKNLVAESIAQLTKRRALLLEEEELTQQLRLGSSKSDGTVEGNRRWNHEEGQRRTLLRLIDAVTRLRKARHDGVFLEPESEDNGSADPSSEPQADAPAKTADVPSEPPVFLEPDASLSRADTKVDIWGDLEEKNEADSHPREALKSEAEQEVAAEAPGQVKPIGEPVSSPLAAAPVEAASEPASEVEPVVPAAADSGVGNGADREQKNEADSRLRRRRNRSRLKKLRRPPRRRQSRFRGRFGAPWQPRWRWTGTT